MPTICECPWNFLFISMHIFYFANFIYKFNSLLLIFSLKVMIFWLQHLKILTVGCFFPEPGYYEDGKFGIRLENVLIVKEGNTKFNFGDKGYLTFEHITWVKFFSILLLYMCIFSHVSIFACVYTLLWWSTKKEGCWRFVLRCLSFMVKMVIILLFMFYCCYWV